MNRPRALLVTLALLAGVSALVPMAAGAAPPDLYQVAQKRGHIVALWSFAPGQYASRAIQVADSPETEDTGFFPADNTEKYTQLPAAALNWRFRSTVGPGLHFVHVLVENLNCAPGDFTCDVLEWSNIRRIRVPMPRPASPTRVRAHREGRRIFMRWRLPAGRYTAGLVEVSRRKARNADGFTGRLFDFDYIEKRVNRWHSIRLDPGTYYAHVGAELNICGIGQDEGCGRYGWSKVVRVVIPKPPPPPVPRRFRGRTTQGRRVAFTVFDGEVSSIRISYRFNCDRGTRTGTATLGSADLSRSGSFRDHDDWLFTDGSTGDSWITGGLRGRNRARGTFRFVTRGGFNGGCSTGLVRWRAST